MANGVVLEIRGGEQIVHVRSVPGGNLWWGAGLYGQAPSPDEVNDFLFQHGVLMVRASGSHYVWKTNDDLSRFDTVKVGNTFVIEGSVSSRDFSGEREAKLTVKLLREEDVDIGECTYVGRSFGFSRHVIHEQERFPKIPGHFTYVPELRLVVKGAFPPFPTSFSAIRKRNAQDWFGS